MEPFINQLISAALWLLFPVFLVGAFSMMAGNQANVAFRPLFAIAATVVSSTLQLLTLLIETLAETLAKDTDDLRRSRKYSLNAKRNQQHKSMAGNKQR